MFAGRISLLAGTMVLSTIAITAGKILGTFNDEPETFKQAVAITTMPLS